MDVQHKIKRTDIHLSVLFCTPDTHIVLDFSEKLFMISL